MTVRLEGLRDMTCQVESRNSRMAQRNQADCRQGTGTNRQAGSATGQDFERLVGVAGRTSGICIVKWYPT